MREILQVLSAAAAALYQIRSGERHGRTEFCRDTSTQVDPTAECGNGRALSAIFVQSAVCGRNGLGLARDRRGLHPCQSPIPAHGIVKIGPYYDHCKGGAIARLSAASAADGRTT